jgi:hypothetical protein
MIPITLKDSISDNKSQEAASAALWRESYENFSFLLLEESGISFCPEKSIRLGRRAKRGDI